MYTERNNTRGETMPNKTDGKRIRISMDIPENIHKEIKIKSAERNIFMTDWVLRAIVRKLHEERLDERH